MPATRRRKTIYSTISASTITAVATRRWAISVPWSLSGEIRAVALNYLSPGSGTDHRFILTTLNDRSWPSLCKNVCSNSRFTLLRKICGELSKLRPGWNSRGSAKFARFLSIPALKYVFTQPGSLAASRDRQLGAFYVTAIRFEKASALHHCHDIPTMEALQPCHCSALAVTPPRSHLCIPQ